MKRRLLDYRGKSFALVIALHTAVIYAAVHERDYVPPMTSVPPLQVSLISSSESLPAKPEPKRPLPKLVTSVSDAVAAPIPQAATTSAENQAQVIPAIYNAAYLKNPQPKYPALSQRLGEEGVVMLRVYVEANGSAREVLIQASSGWPRLDVAAKQSVERWTFAPARRGDQPVSAWVVVPVKFSLSQQG